jgi:hypothetical protein
MSVEIFSFKPGKFEDSGPRIHSGTSHVSLVRIIPASGPREGQPGTGFILKDYPNLVITARHVVKGARSGRILVGHDGNDVPIDVKTQDDWSLAYYSVGDADVAVIRLDSEFESSLERGSSKGLMGGTRVTIKRYDDPKKSVSAEVFKLDNEWLELTETAPDSASGAPVYMTVSGVKQVIGVFVGDSSTNGAHGKAYAIDAPAMKACIKKMK